MGAKLGISSGIMDVMLAQLDEDGSGTVTFDEWVN